MYWTHGLHRRTAASRGAGHGVRRSGIRSFSEQAGRISRVASALRRLGVRDGERVAILARNSDRFVELLLAVPWANGVLAPLNIRWAPSEIGYTLLRDCGRQALTYLDVDDTVCETHGNAMQGIGRGDTRGTRRITRWRRCRRRAGCQGRCR